MRTLVLIALVLALLPLAAQRYKAKHEARTAASDAEGGAT